MSQVGIETVAPRRSVTRRLGRLLLWNFTAAAAAMLVFGGVTTSTPIARILGSFGISLVYSTCITALSFATLSRLGPWLAPRVAPAVYWAVMIAALVAAATVGSLVALMLFSSAGILRLNEILAAMRGTLRISIAITLAIGITMTVVETMRGRLENALVALRTKERDEAEARRAATEARLASLESRVRPHFLFNTLNSIAALIPQDPAAAEKMTGQLASLLRSSLDVAGSPLVPLRQELRHVRDYLDIERVRFGHRLRFSVVCPAEFEEVLVPRFAVQTVVENSVKYAVSPRRDGGTIQVTASGSSSDVSLAVEDDGPGFDLSQMPAQHGLALLRDRLRLSFADRASINVQAGAGHTRVTLVIPR
jgi:LytS/YehU family sensor histidine kinase